MSVLVVGLSHRSAPVDVLERAAVAADEVAQAARRAAARRRTSPRRAALHLQPGRGLRGRRRLPRRPCRRRPRCSAGTPGCRCRELTEHVYVHYAGPGRAAPVRGRRRARLDGRRRGPDPRPAARRLRRRRRDRHRRPGAARAGPAGAAGRQAGARQHRHRHGRRAPWSPRRWPTRPPRSAATWPGAGRVVVGAGAMGGLAAAHLRRAGAGRDRRAEPHPGAGRPAGRDHRASTARRPGPVGLAGLRRRARRAPMCVVACTGAVGAVVDRGHVAAAVAGRGGRPLVVCDLGLPRDVEPGVAALPGVTRDRPGGAAAPARRRRAAGRPSPRPRSWSPRRRRPTWPRSARPRSPRPSRRCAGARPR